MKEKKNKGQKQEKSKPKKIQKVGHKEKLNPVFRDKKFLKELGISKSESTSLQPFDNGLKIPVKVDKIEEVVVTATDLIPDEEKILSDVPGLYYFSDCVTKSDEKLPSVDGWTSGLNTYGWGEQWGHSKISCRCKRCEYKQTIPKMKGSKFIIFCDIDNIGMSLFSMKNDTKKAFLNDSFLWGFHGGGLATHLDKKHVNIYSVLHSNERKLTHDDLLGTVFEKYYLEDHLRFSICGWKNQAADQAILKTLEVFAPRAKCIVLSKDKPFLKMCKTLIKDLPSICIDGNKKTKDDIWKDIETFVNKNCK